MINRTTTILAIATIAIITAGCGRTAKESQGSVLASDGHNGTFTDSRDGRKYRTVKIGNQRWMAEGLKYKTGVSWCYDEKDKCKTLGLNYDWDTAQEACPAGWHLPSDAEWDALARFVDPDYKSENDNVAGKKLKAKSGWEEHCGQNGNGTDEYGFSALPDGNDGNNPGRSRVWWTSTDHRIVRGSFNGRCWGMTNCDTNLSGGRCRDNFRNEVRCVENTDASKATVPAAPIKQPVNAVPAMPGESFSDSRDGKKYRMVKIGNLTWMAENLNYKTGNSWCYDDNVDNCQKYGRIYDWNTANTACPSGWRLPTRQDWNDLGKAAISGRYSRNDEGKKLKSISGWKNKIYDSSGTDEFGFSALPGGQRISHGSFVGAGSRGYWWSATEHEKYDGVSAWYWNMSPYDSYIESFTDKVYGFSVRCAR